MRDNYGGDSAKIRQILLSDGQKRDMGQIYSNIRPVDRRDNYVKRCIGIPGDTVTIKAGILYVNGKIVPDNKTQQTTYVIGTNGTTINPKAFERLNISRSDQTYGFRFGILSCLLQKQMQKQYQSFQMLLRSHRFMQGQGNMLLIFSHIIRIWMERRQLWSYLDACKRYNS